MARVTVEDCTQYVPDIFELVVLAAHRSRQFSAGAKPLVDRDNDKNPVVALREIGKGLIDPEELRDAVIASHCQFKKVAPQEEELEELLEKELSSTQYITEQLFETGPSSPNVDHHVTELDDNTDDEPLDEESSSEEAMHLDSESLEDDKEEL